MTNNSYTYLAANNETIVDISYNVSSLGDNDTRRVELNDIKVGFAIAGLVVAPLGLIGNILTIIVLMHKTMRSSTNSYLTALAVWDSIVIVASLFLIYLAKFVPLVFCAVQLCYPAGLTAQTATIWITVSFTVERFIAVCHPLRAASMCTIRRARIVIFSVSLGSVLYNLPRWFEYHLVPLCEVNYTEFGKNKVFQNTYYWFYVPIMCLVPLTVLSVINIFLIRAVRASSHQRADMNVRQSRENNVTIMLVSVVVVFIICQVPASVYNLTYAIDQIKTTTFEFQVLSNIRNFLVMVNSTINFLLYCAFGQKFRRTFVRLVFSCLVTETLGRQHSFSHISNTAGAYATHYNVNNQRNSANNQYTRIPNHGRSPYHHEQTNNRASTGKATRSGSAIMSHNNKEYIKTAENTDTDFVEVSKPIIEEYELSDLRLPSMDDNEVDSDSHETVLRQLIPDTESFCVYKVDFQKYKNGMVA